MDLSDLFGNSVSDNGPGNEPLLVQTVYGADDNPVTRIVHENNTWSTDGLYGDLVDYSEAEFQEKYGTAHGQSVINSLEDYLREHAQMPAQIEAMAKEAWNIYTNNGEKDNRTNFEGPEFVSDVQANLRRIVGEGIFSENDEKRLTELSNQIEEAVTHYDVMGSRIDEIKEDMQERNLDFPEVQSDDAVVDAPYEPDGESAGIGSPSNP
ncbi:MAG: hypothetical protein H6861_00170 [Rhodospirillales bacterium]|nr:hypothetical protein [Rhodospirillales bacterium]